VQRRGDDVKGGKLKPRPAGVKLLDLVAADKAEYGSRPGRNPKCIPHWKPGEMAVAERFARGVLSKKYRNAVLAVEPCRAAIARCAGGIGPELRTRQSVHRMLVLTAIKLGRVKSRVRWTPEEKAVLDRFAQAVADGRILTARGAGKACVEALRRLHRRYPKKFAGAPDRNEAGIQGELWPRVAKLCYRWFNSQWTAAERKLVDVYTRRLIAHGYPTMREAAKACCRAINRMHARKGRRGVGRNRTGPVRTPGGTFDQMFTRSRELEWTQLPHRQWTPVEQRVAARWARKFLLHRRGKLRMNVRTIAGLMTGELRRLGYYRPESACMAEIYEQWRQLRGLGRASKPNARRWSRTTVARKSQTRRPPRFLRSATLRSG
jgi:hypothetical protein